MSQNSQKTIIQILPSLQSGGVERGVVDISKELKNQGYNPIVISNGGSMTYLLKESDIKHITLDVKSKNPFKIFSNIKKLRKIIDEDKADLVHIRSRAPMISGYFACKKLKVKLVSTVHGPYSLNLGSKQSKLKKLYNSFMVKSDHIIAVSNFIKEYILSNYQDIDPDLEKKITVIPRGVDLKSFNPESVFVKRNIDLSTKWNLPEDKKIILFPARITSWKGHEFLIDSLKKVKSDFLCVFVGSDHGHEDFRKKIEEKIISDNLAGKIKLVGPCSDMPTAYSLANLVISASIKPEAFGRVAIESQAMEKITIATKIGGSLETIIDKETGFLVENKNIDEMAKTIDKALNLDEKESNKITKNSRKHIEKNFSNQKMYNSVIEVYRSLLS